MSVDRTNPATRVAQHQESGAGIARIGFPVGLRRVSVLRREQVTESMVRLTLGGPELEGFHTYQADDHVKIVFPLPDGTRNDPGRNDDDELDWHRPMPPTRKYTVRRYDPDALELDLDFVVHEGGLASGWVLSAEVGEPVVVAGPPGAMTFPLNFDHYVFAVDTTGLPAVARWLDESPHEVSADVLVDTDHAPERDYPLVARDGVRVQWLDRSAGSSLSTAVGALDLPEGTTFLFAAGEAGDIKPLRKWGRKRVTTSLVTGYWKRGVAGLDE